MGGSFLITLREGLEISLVLAIILTYLAKTERRHLFRPVAVGSLIAAAVCIVAGVVFHLAVGEFEGKTEQAIEGCIALLAAAVLTWMIFWMRKNARGMSVELRQKIDLAADRSAKAVAFVAFAAVLREGFETVLFLLGAESGSSSGAAVVVGGFLGLIVSAIVGVFIYRSGNRINLKTFFTVTGGLLILFAAGLFGKAVHEFRELFEIEGWAAQSLWTVASGPLATGWVHDFLKGIFGWSPDPERIRVIAYFAYLIPVAIAFFGNRKPTAFIESAKSATTQAVPSPAR
jgi:high-affinity iron transporter